MAWLKTIDLSEPIRTTAPALLPALAVVAGTYASAWRPPIVWVAALLALGLALSGRAGFTVAALAVGLAGAGLRPVCEPRVDPGRPVELVASIVSHPLCHDNGEAFFYARARSWRQGRRVESGAFDLQVTVAAGAPSRSLGETVRLRGYLRRSAGFANTRQRLGPWRMRLKSGRFLILEAPPGRLAGFAGAFRRRADTALGAAGSSALVRALVLGDRTRLPKAWRQALRRSGLAHLLAVSGLHVGLLALVLGLAGTALPRRLRYLPAVLGVAAYVALIGPQPAVLRASGMGLLALVALALHRPPQGLNALACCVAAMVLADPAIAARLGFQLSAAATAGILVLAPRYALRWTWLPAAWRQPAAVAVAAQLATLPWTLPLSGGVHPLAPLLNLAAIPYLGASLLLSFLWLTLALVSSAVAAALAPVIDAATWPLAAAAELPPVSMLFWPLEVPAAAVPVAWAAAIAASLWPGPAARLGVVTWLLLQTGGPPATELRVPEMVVLDVGQGDAVVLRDGRRAVLVDGGGWPHGDLGGRVVVPALAAMGIQRLEALVLTHPDRDHCAGLVDVARYLPVREVWAAPGWVDDPCAAALLAAAGRWRVLWQGEAARLGRWRLEVLHPPAGLRHGRNDRSLVLAAAVAGRRVLLTGDVGAGVERRLVRSAGSLRAEVLKVAHHGSKSSTTAAWLAAVRPRLALISAGPSNPHGHPHPAVVGRLRVAGARVLRTDRSGMIRLRFPASGTSIELPASPRASRR